MPGRLTIRLDTASSDARVRLLDLLLGSSVQYQESALCSILV